MKTVFWIVSFVIFAVFGFKACQSWNNFSELQRFNADIKQRIAQTEQHLQSIEHLSSDSIDDVKENYGLLVHQLQIMGRYYGLKTSIEVKNLSADGEVGRSVSATQWKGIDGLKMSINFYDLKAMDEYVAALKFLETAERVDPLRLLSIKQKNTSLQADIQLYGRSL